MKRIIALVLAIVLAAWSAAGASAVTYGKVGYMLRGQDGRNRDESTAWEVDSEAALKNDKEQTKSIRIDTSTAASPVQAKAPSVVKASSSRIYGEPGHGDSKSDAWEIDSVATLIKLRDDVNKGSVASGKYFKLTADLDLSSYTDWEPIGSGYSFRGNFDGDGHTIILNITEVVDEDYVGLFGYATNSTIENLYVTGTIKLATPEPVNVGGVIGEINGGTINNCNFDGTVSVTATASSVGPAAGGIVGFATNRTGTDLLKVTNNSVGRKNMSTVVEVLPVTMTGWAGGIAGFFSGENRAIVVTGNYSRLTTQAKRTGTLTYGTDYNCEAGIFENNIEVEPTITPTITAPTITTSSLSQAKTGQSYSATLTATGDAPITWSVYSGSLPAGLTLSSSGVISGTPTTAGSYMFTVKASNSGGDDTKTFSLVVASGSSSIIYGEAGYEAHGQSENDAWEINSAATLVKVRDDINSGKFSERYYKLTADIDLTAYTDWVPIGNNGAEGDGGNTSVSNAPCTEMGTFDGQGHTVKVNISRSTSSDYRIYGGIFGYVKGTVKNLNVQGTISIEAASGYAFAGGIIARADSGTTIDSCKFSGTIYAEAGSTCNAFAGGIAGFGDGISSPLKITHCRVGEASHTSISASGSYNAASGIVGYFDDDNVGNSVSYNYAKAEISAVNKKNLIYGYRKGGKGTVEGNVEVAPSSSSSVYGEDGYEEHGNSEDDAWEINSAATLKKVRDDINDGAETEGKYYKLTSDIDLTSETSWTSIGDDYSTNSFKGNFDGNGHTVKINLKKSGEATTGNYYIVGLFGNVIGGTVKNLSVEGNITVTSNSAVRAGGVIAAIRGGTVDNCNFDGIINFYTCEIRH